MKTVGSREFKNRLGRYLAQVRNGETITVTDRGKPVARVTPPEPETVESTQELVLRRLEAQGMIRRARGGPRVFKPIRLKGKPLSQMILEDRR